METDDEIIRKMFGTPGEPIPQVDVEDIKTLWKLQDDLSTRYGHAVGIAGIAAILRPGADASAVSHRVASLRLFLKLQEELTKQQGSLPSTKIDAGDSAFQVVADIRMKWGGGPGVVQDGFFFDIEDFVRRVGEAA